MPKPPLKAGKRDAPRRKRLEVLTADYWNPFFDEKIQNILKTRKEPIEWAGEFLKDSPKGMTEAALAWPIMAYEALVEIVLNAWDSADLSWFRADYNRDPVFISELLLALTKYYRLPKSEWSSSRMILKHSEAMNWRSEEYAIAIHISGGTTEPPADLPSSPLITVAEIFERVSEEFAECRNRPRRAENVKALLKDVRRRRTAVQKAWKFNFEARSKFERSSFQLPFRFEGSG